MKYAVIAAGQGSRLIADGISVSKPLLEINGEPLLERLISLFIRHDAERISLIINEEMTDVKNFVEQLNLPVPLDLIIKSTPDSLHSFYELSPYLKGTDKFCLTTVDPIFNEDEFSSYICEFQKDNKHDALMAVTDFIDDESPLYVETDEHLNILGYANEYYPGARYVSGGIYCLNNKVLELLPSVVKKGITRMRGFQQAIIDAGLNVKAFPFSKIIDVDHASDREKAEDFLKNR